MVRPLRTIRRQESILASYRVLARSSERSLKAENKSPHSIATFLASVDQLEEFLTEHGMPTAVHDIAHEHAESFASHILN